MCVCVCVRDRAYMCHYITTAARFVPFRSFNRTEPPVLEGRARESACVCVRARAYKCHYMGWLRLVGSIKVKVFSAKEPYKRDYSAKETYNLIDPTNRSHPISRLQRASSHFAPALTLNTPS